LGILVPREEDGPFPPKDLHRVRLMPAFHATRKGFSKPVEVAAVSWR
jgi:hypothetical protein